MHTTAETLQGLVTQKQRWEEVTGLLQDTLRDICRVHKVEKEPHKVTESLDFQKRSLRKRIDWKKEGNIVLYTPLQLPGSFRAELL